MRRARYAGTAANAARDSESAITGAHTMKWMLAFHFIAFAMGVGMSF